MTQPTPPTCPLTSQPLKPGQTVSDAANATLWNTYQHFRTLVTDAYATLETPHAASGDTNTTHAGTIRDPISLEILDRLDQAVDTVWQWVQAYLDWAKPGTRLTPPSTQNRNTFASQTQTAITHATQRATLTHYPEAAEMIPNLEQAAHTLHRVAYPNHTPKHYAGPCPGCGEDLTTTHTTGTLTCRCGQTVNIQDQRHHMALTLQASVYPRNTARLAAQWITGRHIPQNTIRTWIHRHQLTEPTPGHIRVADLIHLTANMKHQNLIR